MGSFFTKPMSNVMDENMRKQQEFMLASQKMQVRISEVLRSCIYPPLPPVLSLYPSDGASDDYADSNEEQNAGTTIINGQGSLQLVRNNVCIFLNFFLSVFIMAEWAMWFGGVVYPNHH